MNPDSQTLSHVRKLSRNASIVKSLMQLQWPWSLISGLKKIIMRPLGNTQHLSCADCLKEREKIIIIVLNRILQLCTVIGRGVESEQSRSLSIEGDSDSGPYLFHLDFCAILLQSI